MTDIFQIKSYNDDTKQITQKILNQKFGINEHMEIMNEKVLHQIIMENILDFMNQLGNGYCLVGSEYKIKVGNQYNYLDLFLFNYVYNFNRKVSMLHGFIKNG